MFDGAYPPGVTGKMIDELEGINDPRCCGHCSHYNGQYCTKEWNNMEDDYLDKHRDKKDPDDYCDDYDCDDYDWGG